jgi:hypothetical protein
MFRKSIILGLALLCAAPAAFADDHRGKGRGQDRHDNRGGWDRGRDRDRHHDNNWNRGANWNRGHDRHYDRNRTSLSLGFIFGSPGYSTGYRPYYDDYRYREPAYYNEYGLRPNQCRWDREYAYWYGRPADVEVRRCADGYGAVYIVQGSHRLWRYR